MTNRVEEIIEKIREERQRQFDLPGSEWDARNTPGDWVALIGHYLNENVRKNGVDPLAEDFEDSLVKAAAIIVAALQHVDNMKDRQQLL